MSEEGEKTRQRNLDNAAREAAHKVYQMINTPGWKQILEPTLRERKEKLLNQLTLVEPTNHIKFVQLQQMVGAIDMLFRIIETVLAEAKQSS